VQETRQLILEYLKEHGQATVDQLAKVVGLTAVTVRHHLDILHAEGLVTDPLIRHRTSPGRPQYVYALTEKATLHFPKNYDHLAEKIVEEIKIATTPQTVNLIFEGVADRLADGAPKPIEGEPIQERLDRAVAFLNQHGYVARWEATPEGYLLHTSNCPYEALAPNHPELCKMDIKLVQNLLGTIPQPVSRLVEGAASCAYLIREPELAKV